MVRRMNAPLVVDALRERHELYQSELTRLGDVWVLRGVKHRLVNGGGGGGGGGAGRARNHASEAGAFFYAIQQGHLPSVKYMVEDRYAKLSQREITSGRNAICVAIDAGHVDVARYLISMKVDIEAPPCLGRVTELRGFYHNSYEDLPQRYHPMGGEDDAREDETLLHRAAILGHADICHVLLAEGSDPNKRTRDGKTALHSAARCGNARVCQMLLAAGADLNSKDGCNCTPLITAVRHGRSDAVDVLLKRRDVDLHVTFKGESVLTLINTTPGELFVERSIREMLLRCLHEQVVDLAAGALRCHRRMKMRAPQPTVLPTHITHLLMM